MEKLHSMADQSELRMNLAAIKRVDPYAKDIVDSSAHVAFYTFNSEETEWEKTDVEGAFFIYSRNAEPYHSIFINNRLNTNSLVEPITLHIELQSQPPFLLYRNERNRIRGFWFYNKSECDRIGELVEQIVKDCERKQTLLKQQYPTHQQSHSHQMDMARQNTNVDIFSMLSKAQEDFNNSQGSIGSIGTNPKQPKPNDGTSQSVMNFFAAAKPAAAKEVPFFQRMLSNPVHVDQIEKQQRASSPPQQDPPPPPPQTSAAIIATTTQQLLSNSLNTENGFMRIHSPNNHELGTSPLATFLHGSNLSVPRNATGQPATVATATDVSEIESRQHQQQQQPLHQLLKKTDLNSNTPGKPALMPPTMFKSSSAQVAGGAVTAPLNSNAKSKPIHIDNPILQQDPVSLVTKLHHNKTKPAGDANVTAPEPLTQSQLLQAMTYLIKNDPEFVRKLHEAYLKSFTEMVSL